MPVSIPNSVRPRQELAYVAASGTSLAVLEKRLLWANLFPQLALSKRNAHLPKLTVAGTNVGLIVSDLAGEGAAAPRITLSVTDQSLTTIGLRKREVGIPVESQLDYDGLLSLETAASSILGTTFALTLEYLAMQEIVGANATTNWGSATNSVVAYTEANIATISAIVDIQLSLERVRAKGTEPDSVVISRAVWNRIIRADNVNKFTQSQVPTLSAQSTITPNVLADAFNRQGYDIKVYIGDAKYTSSREGASTATLTSIWNNTYIWTGKAGSLGGETAPNVPSSITGAGILGYWEPLGPIVFIESFYDQLNEQQVVRGKTSGTITITDTTAGDLIATQYS